jgi:hypothetical protein
MKFQLLKGARIAAGFVVVWSTFANFLNLSLSFGGTPSRKENDLEINEALFLPIRNELFGEGQVGGNLGYVSVRSVIGKPVDLRDAVRWSKLRYVAIPFILLPDPQGATYLIGDYTGDDPVPESLEGFVKMYDKGSGLVLYKKAAP